LVGVAVRNGSPYRHVLTHGWTLDAKGQPMSKSLGNVVLPAEICEKWGADLLRLWVASQDFTADVRMSDNVMKQLSEAYRKLRNTFRFALGNLADFDPARDAVPDDRMEEFDRWMLARTAELVRDCRKWYENFEFHRVFHALHDFAVVDLSAFYFDVLKDRLYTFARRGRARRSAQTAVYRISSALLRLAAPIISFTAEEIWKHFPHKPGEPDSVHLALFPTAEELGMPLDPVITQNWDRLLELRNDVLSALEAARNEKLVAGALEAKISVEPRTDVAAPERAGLVSLLHSYQNRLPALFIVSQFQSGLAEGENPGAVKEPAPKSSPWIVRVERADGTKCERCWNYSTHVGENAEYPTICERCVAALAENKRDGVVYEEGAAS
jgi:isoleucyl-tRNA synthetase